MNNKVVSFENERLIVVDPDDNILGYKSKNVCHDGEGILHRAFSIFIFNSKNEVLMQQRADGKRLWPLIWSNSCCSHPRENETYEFATQRRLEEELGIKTHLTYLYKFQYHARYKNEGSENELCSVYIGKTNELPKVNATEIADWKYFARNDLEEELSRNPEIFSPWFKMEWQQLKDNFWQKIENLK